MLLPRVAGDIETALTPKFSVRGITVNAVGLPDVTETDMNAE
jgi:hypothetical protein